MFSFQMFCDRMIPNIMKNGIVNVKSTCQKKKVITFVACFNSMVIRVVEFSSEEYKIRKIFA